VIAIIAVIDLVLLFGFGLARAEPGQALFSQASLLHNAPMLIGGACATGGVVGLASLARIIALRGGGGKVAMSVGGVRVEHDSVDPLRRRLVNVVEEIALASGVPVPEIYILEQEAGINAFAAGYSPADAAIAVTRGTLEKLDRSELQGVIAHEFSHVLNGDMRLNIRLMGALFGILMLALIGRRVLHHTAYMGRSRNKEGAAVMALALALVVVGYVGLFFGRWIKSAVSRQREYLADASAVQFTRDPQGIAGALKKIAIYSNASLLNADTEEVGHMLFGEGRKAHLFATHPPLDERIARIEPGFTRDDLNRLAARLQREQLRERSAAEKKSSERQRHAHAPFDAGRIIQDIGQPGFERLLMAAAIASSLPEPVNRVARAPGASIDVLLYSLLHSDAQAREQQLLLITETLGEEHESRVRQWVAAVGLAAAEQRLPLLEIALPGLRRRPPERILQFLSTVDAMVRVDGRVEVFEYLMVRTIKQYLWESANPHRVRSVGNHALARHREQAEYLLAVLAVHGHPDKPEVALSAFSAGVRLCQGTASQLPEVGDWAARLDEVLDRLDTLRAEDKQALVSAMLATVSHDGQLVPVELELLRVACMALHVPIPALLGGT
jgi:Zn-dependent protease with chaperone function